jgi:hypothetical protein
MTRSSWTLIELQLFLTDSFPTHHWSVGWAYDADVLWVCCFRNDGYNMRKPVDGLTISLLETVDQRREYFHLVGEGMVLDCDEHWDRKLQGPDLGDTPSLNGG